MTDSPLQHLSAFGCFDHSGYGWRLGHRIISLRTGRTLVDAGLAQTKLSPRLNSVRRVEQISVTPAGIAALEQRR